MVDAAGTSGGDGAGAVPRVHPAASEGGGQTAREEQASHGLTAR